VPDWTDHDLVKRCAEGDRQALADAVRLHLPSLLRYARSRCDGELAATEVLLRAVARAGRALVECAEAPSVLAWLLRSVHRSCASVDGRRPTGGLP